MPHTVPGAKKKMSKKKYAKMVKAEKSKASGKRRAKIAATRMSY